MSTKVNVNIRLDRELKEKAKKIAESKWTTLSTVLNMYLVDFVDTWKIRYLWSEDEIEIEEFTEKEMGELEKLPNFKSFIKTAQWI